MHEFSICAALLQQLEELTVRHRAASVRRVTVQVGALSGVEPSLLRAAFAVARRGSCAQEAELTLETLPLRIRCGACAVEAEATPDYLACRVCGSIRTELVSGDALLLRTVELMTPAEEPAALDVSAGAPAEPRPGTAVSAQ